MFSICVTVAITWSFEGDVGNLLVVARDAKIAQIRSEAEARQQFLLDRKAKHPACGGRQKEERAVGRLAAIAELERKCWYLSETPAGNRMCPDQYSIASEGTP